MRNCPINKLGRPSETFLHIRWIISISVFHRLGPLHLQNSGSCHVPTRDLPLQAPPCPSSCCYGNLHYEQNAIMGVVMLLVEGSLVFAENEREYFRHVASTREESKMRKFGSVVVFLLAIAIKGVLPVSLIVIAFLTSLDKLLIMSYVPLAFFFLSLVFFAAVDLWFFRDACTEVSRQFSRPSPRLIIIPIHNNSMPSPPTTAINNDGLKKLLLSRDGVGGSVHITENALWDKDLNLSRDLDMPAILPLQSSTPDEMKGQLVIDM